MVGITKNFTLPKTDMTKNCWKIPTMNEYVWIMIKKWWLSSSPCQFSGVYLQKPIFRVDSNSVGLDIYTTMHGLLLTQFDSEIFRKVSRSFHQHSLDRVAPQQTTWNMTEVEVNWYHFNIQFVAIAPFEKWRQNDISGYNLAINSGYKGKQT